MNLEVGKVELEEGVATSPGADFLQDFSRRRAELIIIDIVNTPNVWLSIQARENLRENLVAHAAVIDD